MTGEIMFKFDEVNHTYTLNDRRLPSVTEVIRSNFGDPFNSKDWYMQRGKALHKAIELISKDKLDWNSVHNSIKPRLVSFQKFLENTKSRILDSEIRMYSKRLRFAGTADAVLEGIDGLYLVDFKSSVTPEVDIQLGGYSIMYTENDLVRPIKLMAVELGENNYKIRIVKNPKHAERLFMCCLQIHNFKLTRGE